MSNGRSQTSLSSDRILLPLFQVLKLTRVQEVAIGIGLLYSSNRDIQSFASQFLKTKLPELLRSYTDAETALGVTEGGLHDVATEVLHLIIYHLHDRNKKSALGVTETLKNSFFETLREVSVSVLKIVLVFAFMV